MMAQMGGLAAIAGGGLGGPTKTDLYVTMLKSEAVKDPIIDRFKLNAPIVGPIIKKSIISRFCRTLGTLLSSGVPILEALAIVKNATGNEIVRDGDELAIFTAVSGG